MTDNLEAVDESLEEGYSHGNPGRSPDRPGDYTGQELSEAYEDESIIKEANDLLTSTEAKVASGTVVGAELIDTMHNVVDLPVVQEYPEAVSAVALGATAVAFYNALDYTKDQLTDETEERFPADQDDYLDMGKLETHDAKREMMADQRERLREAKEFDPSEAEVLDDELREELAEMPGKVE